LIQYDVYTFVNYKSFHHVGQMVFKTHMDLYIPLPIYFSIQRKFSFFNPKVFNQITMKLEWEFKFSIFLVLYIKTSNVSPYLTSIPIRGLTYGFKSCPNSSLITILCKIMQASIMSIMVFKSHCLQRLATMAHRDYKTPKSHSRSLWIAFYIMAKC
jgi:hypothetical protein